MPLAEAKNAVSFQILTPSHALANTSNIIATYVCLDEVIIYFESGIREFMEDQGEGAAPPWDMLAAQDPAVTVGSIRGKEAALIDPTKDPSGSALGGVEFVEEGILISIVGDGKIALDELIAVAESLGP